jgi:hypothetical protein
MLYQFDMTSDDYVEMSLSATSTKSVVQGYKLHALVPALVLWIVVHDVAGISAVVSAALAVALFGGILAYHALTWRKTFGAKLREHHEGPVRAILGPHTLELTDEGLHSVGPMHRTFRAWPCITTVVTWRSYIFFHTLFGVVYVLPTRAVEDSGSLFSELKARDIPIHPAD